MPDKIYGPNYRWRRGLVDAEYAALYPSREEAPTPPNPTNLYVDAGYVDADYVTEN